MQKMTTAHGISQYRPQLRVLQINIKGMSRSKTEYLWKVSEDHKIDMVYENLCMGSKLSQ